MNSRYKEQYTVSNACNSHVYMRKRPPSHPLFHLSRFPSPCMYVNTSTNTTILPSDSQRLGNMPSGLTISMSGQVYPDSILMDDASPPPDDHGWALAIPPPRYPTHYITVNLPSAMHPYHQLLSHTPHNPGHNHPTARIHATAPRMHA